MNFVVNLDLMDIIADDEVLEAEVVFSDSKSLEKIETKYFVIQYDPSNKEIYYIKTRYNYKDAGVLGKFDDQFTIKDITSKEKFTLEELFEAIFG